MLMCNSKDTKFAWSSCEFAGYFLLHFMERTRVNKREPIWDLMELVRQNRPYIIKAKLNIMTLFYLPTLEKAYVAEEFLLLCSPVMSWGLQFWVIFAYVTVF